MLKKQIRNYILKFTDQISWYKIKAIVVYLFSKVINRLRENKFRSQTKPEGKHQFYEENNETTETQDCKKN